MYYIQIKVNKNTWRTLLENKKPLKFSTVALAKKHVFDTFRGLPESNFQIINQTEFDALTAAKSPV